MFPRRYKMSDVAMFVGAALNHPTPPCNGTGPISTIHVDQYKTKFNDIRIYCTLAKPDLVKEVWASLGESGDPPKTFFDKCLRRDASIYRECHLAMFRLLDDEDMIASLKAPAVYSELLCKSPEELDRLLDYNVEKSKLYPQYLQQFYSRWGVSDPGALRELLYSLSGFRMNE